MRTLEGSTNARRTYILLGAIVLLAGLAYIRAFWSSYVSWDDDKLILQNFTLQSPFWEACKVIWSKPWAADYLPIPLMSFWAEVHLWGFNPTPPHILNWFLHLVNVALVFLWLSELGVSGGTVLFATAIFAVHPLQTESVMWISERNGLLSCLFLMIALLAYLRMLRADANWSFVAYPVFFLASGLCKTNAVLLPFALMAIEIANGRKGNRRLFALRHGPAMLGAVILSVVRYLAYATVVFGLTEKSFSIHSLIQVPLIAVVALGHYLLAYIWPEHLSIIYPPFSHTTAIALKLGLGVTFIASWLVLSISKRSKEVFYGGLWFIILLLPVLQIVPRVNFVTDRYMYLPIIGLSVFLVGVGRLTWGVRLPLSIRWGMAAGFVLCLVALSYQRAQVWENSYSLWADTVKEYPRSQLAWTNLGVVQIGRGQIREAATSFATGSQGDIEDAYSFMNLAILYSDRTRWPDLYQPERALKLLHVALQVAASENEIFLTQYNIGWVLYQIHRNTESVKVLDELVSNIQASPNGWVYKDLKQRIKEVVRADEEKTKN